MFENLKNTFNKGKSVESTQQFAQNINAIAQGPGLFGLAGTPQQTSEIPQQSYPYQETTTVNYQQATIAPVQATSQLPSSRWKRTCDKKQRLMLEESVPCYAKRV
jgi:hypothetical protein